MFAARKCPTVLACTVFKKINIFLFEFYFGMYLFIFRLIDSFFGCLESNDDPNGGILYLCYIVFDFQYFDSIRVSIFLLIYLLLQVVYIFQLEPLTY